MAKQGIYVSGLHLQPSLEGADYFSTIDSLRNLKEIQFEQPVTFFVGENGSGKSTLLEAIAIHYGMNAEGGSRNYHFSTAESYSNLSDYLVLHKTGNLPTDTFFLRAESFYNVATYIDQTMADFSEYGDVSLHAQSHGESFLNLIKYRFRGNGFYLLDEPEAALSPQRQLSLLVLLDELRKKNSQLIIATHSPILLSLPNAVILSFDGRSLQEINYEDTSAYQTTKMVIDHRERLFKNLFDSDDIY